MSAKNDLTKEYLEECFRKGWTYKQISKDCGWCISVIEKMLKTFGVKRTRIDLTGKRFGKLLVIGKGHKFSGESAQRKCVTWICQCDCGALRENPTSKLTSGSFKSCGCGRGKKEGDLNWSLKYWNKIRFSAQYRSIAFGLCLEEAREILENQNGKCALTGWEIGLGRRSLQTASLDRIDSSKGYYKENVQWVHKDANRAKSDFTMEYFIDLCKSVAKMNP